MELSETTPLILTYNEQENIDRTLRALSWAKQVILIDSFSTDRTVELARAAHPSVQVIQRPFDTHASQWNFGLEQVTSEWVLALDADYQLPPDFEQELSRIEPASGVTGYEAEFVYCIFGQPLRATLYPPHTILFRKNQGTYIDEGHTQVLRLSGNVRRLNSRILHDDRKPLSRWMASQDRYSTLEARHLLTAPSEKLSAPDRLRKRIFFAPAAVFLYLLVGKGLILDGWRGWYYVCQRTIAETLLSLRLLTERGGLEHDRSPSEPAG